jgi:hypothetical protein
MNRFRRERAALAAALCILLLEDVRASHPTREDLIRNVEGDFREISALLRRFATEHGRLPKSLAEIPGVAKYSDDWESIETGCRRNYGYSRSPDGMVAILVSVGIDGKPNTPDDYTMIIDIHGRRHQKLDGSLRESLLRSAYMNSPCKANPSRW